ncbi:hypothetical protein [Lederbergia lenta]|uniref:Uncharacterized protein n=1 Tax=Lederbergia lenta TaxID=1467 RepID=A0A2X4YID0_LEDLE|nr:hypothetical protein [Lederbergia lenta]MEC2323745.1 hypothetical protein [Lederbergia lenta]SQI51525.1 Uncharacterised protein [Lederbergia lenta]
MFYPTDWRVSQEYTLVKEVTKTGKEVKKYKIIDDEFTRMIPNQKPNNMNQLYLSFFGDAEIDNYYFTYDIQNNSFKKVELNYFDYKVGIDHLAHYGNDIIFRLIHHIKQVIKTTMKNREDSTSPFQTQQHRKVLKQNITVHLHLLQFCILEKRLYMEPMQH